MTGQNIRKSFRDYAHLDDSYHGVTYVESFGVGGAFITKATVQLMRDFGSMQSPQNAVLA